jgi:hypothetical protein
MRSLLPILLGALIASACASPDYKSPTSGPLARIRFAAESNGVSVLYQYTDDQCEQGEVEVARLRTGTLFNTNSKSLGIPLNTYHPNASHEVVVQAGQKFVGLFSGGEDAGMMSFTCKVPFVFQPVERDYEVLFTVAPRNCRVIISSIDRDSAGQPLKNPVRAERIYAESCTRFKFRAF